MYTLQLYAPLYRRVTTLSRIRVEGDGVLDPMVVSPEDHRTRTVFCHFRNLELGNVGEVSLIASLALFLTIFLSFFF